MTTISSISSDCSKAAIVCSMIGLPATLISCLGMLEADARPGPAGQDHGDVTQCGHRLTVAVRGE